MWSLKTPGFSLFLLSNKDLFRIFLLSKIIFRTLPGKGVILGNHGKSHLPPRYHLSPVFQVVDMVSYQFHVTTVLPSCHVCLYLTSLNQNLKCYFLTRTQHDWGSDSVKFEFSMKFYHKKLVSEWNLDTGKPFWILIQRFCMDGCGCLAPLTLPFSLWQNKFLVSKFFFKLGPGPP